MFKHSTHLLKPLTVASFGVSTGLSMLTISKYYLLQVLGLPQRLCSSGTCLMQLPRTYCGGSLMIFQNLLNWTLSVKGSISSTQRHALHKWIESDKCDIQHLTFEVIHPVNFLHSSASIFKVPYFYKIGLVFSKGSLQNVKYPHKISSLNDTLGLFTLTLGYRKQNKQTKTVKKKKILLLMLYTKLTILPYYS